MAKKRKELTPYQQARRQFVQQRVEARGVEGTPEERAKYRKRFDVLAETKQGRGKIAQQLNVEDPKAFRRMLATEMPARSDLPKTGDTGTKGSTYKAPNAKQVTAGWQQAVKSGSYKVPTPATKTPIVSPPITKTSTKSTGNAWTNRRSNVIGQGINYPGRGVIEGIVNPFGQKGPIKDLSVKGIAKAAAGELGEAAFAVPATKVAGGALKAGASVMKFGLRQVGKLLPKLGDASINKFGGVGKKPYGPQAPAGGSKPMLELGPGPAPAPSSVSATAAAGRSNVAPRSVRLRINTKGGVGGKPYGPQAPASSARPTPPKGPLPSQKRMLDDLGKQTDDYQATLGNLKNPKSTTPKTTAKPAPKKSDPDDMAYVVGQMKSRYPGMTEKDIPFLQSLNRAQQAIENKSPGYQGYAKWLKNQQTVATLRRLRGK